MATITDRGLTIDFLPDILNKIEYKLNQRFAPILPSGESVDFDESSMLQRVLGPIAELIAEQELIIQELSTCLDIDQVQGIKLDRYTKLGGVLRPLQTATEVLLILFGNPNIFIPTGSQVSSKTTGFVYQTNTDVTLDTNDVSGIVFNPTGVGTLNTYTLTWGTSGNPNTNVPVVVTIPASYDAATTVATLAQNINNASAELTASVVNTNQLSVIFSNQNLTGSLNMTNSTVVQVYKQVVASAVIKGPSNEDANSITVIQSPILGWLGVNNPYAAVSGSNTLTDDEYRLYYKAVKQKNGVSLIDTLYAQLKLLDGVTFTKITENKSGVQVGALPPHSFAPVVLGGDDTDIAQVIFNNTPLGINTFGSITKSVQDINGNPNDVSFSRPNFVPIQIQISLETTNAFPDNGVSLIQQAIVDYFNKLTVGDTVYYSKLFIPINTVDGQSVNSLKLSRIGQPLTSDNVTMSYNELPTISASDIQIG